MPVQQRRRTIIIAGQIPKNRAQSHTDAAQCKLILNFWLINVSMITRTRTISRWERWVELSIVGGNFSLLNATNTNYSQISMNCLMMMMMLLNSNFPHTNWPERRRKLGSMWIYLCGWKQSVRASPKVMQLVAQGRGGGWCESTKGRFSFYVPHTGKINTTLIFFIGRDTTLCWDLTASTTTYDWFLILIRVYSVLYYTISRN